MRTSNLHLPIETGRWANIPRQDRICTLCNENIGDEVHILFRCKNQNIITLREKKLPIYYYNNPDIRKLEGFLSYCNCHLLKMLSLFIKKVSVLL
jgi:hypothetical protein